MMIAMKCRMYKSVHVNGDQVVNRRSVVIAQHPNPNAAYKDSRPIASG
jgi:hypothetical protein